MKSKTCPICDWEITDAGIKVVVEGKEIVVCCEDCAQKAKERAQSSTSKAR
jgi:ribosome-binding protein aMBF1 (putative translation factor)